jgi:hypothetical protein
MGNQVGPMCSRGHRYVPNGRTPPSVPIIFDKDRSLLEAVLDPPNFLFKVLLAYFFPRRHCCRLLNDAQRRPTSTFEYSMFFSLIASKRFFSTSSMHFAP